MRVRYGPIDLPEDLSRGHWRELKANEMQKLAHLVGLFAEGHNTLSSL
jgi:16S rRNA U516 pseudouridylate synthase RsuA-like enzyme